MGYKKRLKPLPIKRTNEFGMYITYPLDDHSWGALDDKLDKAIGTPHSGSGTGAGGRDLDYWFENAEDMLAAVKRVKALRLKGLNVTHDKICSRCQGTCRLSTRVFCSECNGTGKAD